VPWHCCRRWGRLLGIQGGPSCSLIPPPALHYSAMASPSIPSLCLCHHVAYLLLLFQLSASFLDTIYYSSPLVLSLPLATTVYIFCHHPGGRRFPRFCSTVVPHTHSTHHYLSLISLSMLLFITPPPLPPFFALCFPLHALPLQGARHNEHTPTPAAAMARACTASFAAYLSRAAARAAPNGASWLLFGMHAARTVCAAFCRAPQQANAAAACLPLLRARIHVAALHTCTHLPCTAPHTPATHCLPTTLHTHTAHLHTCLTLPSHTLAHARWPVWRCYAMPAVKLNGVHSWRTRGIFAVLYLVRRSPTV